MKVQIQENELWPFYDLETSENYFNPYAAEYDLDKDFIERHKKCMSEFAQIQHMLRLIKDGSKTSERKDSTTTKLMKEIESLKERVVELERDNFFQKINKEPPFTKGCLVCGLGTNGEIMGYVCPRTDCPSAMRCSS